MSKIKQLLEDREDFVDFIDDDYWCHYAYDDGEDLDIE
jgi:hypothetical protein